MSVSDNIKAAKGLDNVSEKLKRRSTKVGKKKISQQM